MACVKAAFPVSTRPLPEKLGSVNQLCRASAGTPSELEVRKTY